MRKLTHMLLAGTLILACSSCGVETTANYQVIPLPQEVALSQESPFNLNDGTIIAYPEHNELFETQCRVFGRIHQPVHRPHPPDRSPCPGERSAQRRHHIGTGSGHRQPGRLCADRQSRPGDPKRTDRERGCSTVYKPCVNQSPPKPKPPLSYCLPAASRMNPASATGACTSMWAATSFPLSS